jgi:hypothetical protein
MQKIDDPRSLIKVPTRIRNEIRKLAKQQKISMLQVVENAVWTYEAVCQKKEKAK